MRKKTPNKTAKNILKTDAKISMKKQEKQGNPTPPKEYKSTYICKQESLQKLRSENEKLTSRG